jgi:hypothetical protein
MRSILETYFTFFSLYTEKPVRNKKKGRKNSCKLSTFSGQQRQIRIRIYLVLELYHTAGSGSKTLINCFINLEEVVVFVGGVPVDDLVEVGEVSVQVHAVRIVPSDQVVVVSLGGKENISTGTYRNKKDLQ